MFDARTSSTNSRAEVMEPSVRSAHDLSSWVRKTPYVTPSSASSSTIVTDSHSAIQNRSGISAGSGSSDSAASDSGGTVFRNHA